jgi:hypothetical protein
MLGSKMAVVNAAQNTRMAESVKYFKHADVLHLKILA